jgi:hypothetical protein
MLEQMYSRTTPHLLLLLLLPAFSFMLFLVQVAYFSLLALSLGCRVIALEPALHMMP